jgi:queuine tRNA-ribosyltransferase
MKFGIVQGASYADLRRHSAEALVSLGFDGYAVGGVSVGEPEPEMMQAVESSVPYLPADKPRYAMGLGTPPQMVEMVARGIDMFDCVLPTRIARNGTCLHRQRHDQSQERTLHLRQRPDRGRVHLPACRQFSRGYLRHLIKAEEILGLRLISLHNLHFYLELMNRVRASIEAGTFRAVSPGVRRGLPRLESGRRKR